MNWPIIILTFGFGFANGLWWGIQSARTRYWQAKYLNKKLQYQALKDNETH